VTKSREIGERSALGQAYLDGRLAQSSLRGEFRPSAREDVAGVDDLSGDDRVRDIHLGLEVLRRGEVAYGVQIGRAHV